MRIGTDAGPRAATGPTATYHIYDVRSGIIVATHLFSGPAPDSEESRLANILHEAHQGSGIPREHLEVLTNTHVPQEEGAIRVDDATRKLVRSAPLTSALDPRLG